MCRWRWEPVSRRGLRPSWEGAAAVRGAGGGRAGRDSLGWWVHNYYCFFFWNHHIFPCTPPLQFSGAGELFHFEQVISLLEGFHETPPLPLQSFLLSFHPFLSPLLPTLLPASLLWSWLPFPFLPLRISVVRLLLLCFCEPTDCSTPGFPGV